ncbi:MAG: MBL fold metallo-hydrolase [Deltaproteobacteria bacterium]|nr:MBL fold metallo-hydrolase [Deltaproteobacteria bacterium]
MDRVRIFHPPIAHVPPPLARWFCPAGPPSLAGFEHAGVRVIAVPGRYCVSYLIPGPEGTALVDVGSCEDIVRIESVLAWLAGPPLCLVIPSHLHFDHCLGLDPAARHFGATVRLHPLAHEAVARGHALRAPRLRTLGVFFPTWLWQGLPCFAAEDLRAGLRFGFPWSRNPFQAKLGEPLRDGERLAGFPGWQVLHTPGHADDAVCLYHPQAGFLVAGDTVRNFQGGEWNPLLTDPDDYRRTRERLAPLGVQAIFPGHGPVLTGPRLFECLRPVC